MSSGAGSPARALPALARIWDGEVVPLDVERLIADADIIFLALPEAASAELAPKLVERGRRVIDLSGAFRIRDAAARARWYPATTALPDGTVYGFSERNRDAIRSARLLSNPGCYPTAALMALAPLADAGLLVGNAVIDAKSGVSGAGKTPSDRTHFSENHGSVPHLVPLDRGILETIYVSLKPGTTAAAVEQALDAAYGDEPFVRLTGTSLPEIKHVAHTNFCDIGWKVDEAGSRAVLVVVLDNLVKGAAGSAVQNLNIMLGIDERTGLL